ncbi:unnamed protein product [Paramecium pentaurelia]|uniref:Uncharacterized protein n=1 Tax=Paramecium pentaurelia TaxID=43138 RepID=A0A8S1SFR1_9CILI|nr:unnamed protein product [Paramecium pentaurelia]
MDSKQRFYQLILVYNQSYEKMIAVLNTGVQILAIDKQNIKLLCMDIQKFNPLIFILEVPKELQFCCNQQKLYILLFWNNDW